MNKCTILVDPRIYDGIAKIDIYCIRADVRENWLCLEVESELVAAFDTTTILGWFFNNPNQTDCPWK